eukprot:CAMPEP_0119039192 /NCGR_PEP_ID=MMETSP1177-20130426/8560_1 /TAXON_ID=2985 /ORGANISM="Ochromonas sp, Strain CCMP1899" /LENGTH=111 /DNA_ID=CAMNT_0007002771 /DNA_START=232 /DNA_END=564 /DNA_ORIENTATION=-
MNGIENNTVRFLLIRFEAWANRRARASAVVFGLGSTEGVGAVGKVLELAEGLRTGVGGPEGKGVGKAVELVEEGPDPNPNPNPTGLGGPEGKGVGKAVELVEEGPDPNPNP